MGHLLLLRGVSYSRYTTILMATNCQAQVRHRIIPVTIQGATVVFAIRQALCRQTHIDRRAADIKMMA